MSAYRFPGSSVAAAVTLSLISATWLSGCGQPAAGPVSEAPPAAAPAPSTADPLAEAAPPDISPGPKKRKFAPVQLGGGSKSPSQTVIEADARSESVLEHLQPLQVLLGKWTGNARKAAQLHEQAWVWDFQSRPEQPALVLTADQSNYIRNGRLTYLPTENEFEFVMSTPEGASRTLRGTFSQPVEDVAGDDKKLQRTYKLELQEPATEANGEQWQVAFHQLENNRYLVELDRRRGTGPFQRVDTIHSQREGTSFALSDTDYGDRTCIISQGLGTISVSYKGRSFWVCCTGCQSAFNDDPEKWIAKWETRQKSMTQ